ncbi:asparagine synthase (glutamine-hydrolyzing) [Egibacter rhizosphaerae]|uniref:asparagine synthase (glutamine-hydrolyzing) n=2 Tax=Egibacter rhizosphaerae TaxID=1670831 RepID=A0A411YJU9_9ACTN|nr:asparagine synthase (glutamine-hydrolyzing) [Egibacter rhizosphaerae]QBI21478.1 asparagine synthase (glutamine-hydrolyzing) [Egibacter rhizosphaerae]
MLDRLTHRGPDGEGTQTIGNTWLGHRRLAIVDLEGGGQPLYEPDRRLWLIGDGEVYNHPRLRQQLENEGRVFRTESDHEIVLHVLDNEGVDGFTKLWGMYAFILAGADGRFIVGRDPLGITPLYWVRDDDTVLFASELKAFDPDRRNDVEPFPPGHAWIPGDGLVEFGGLPERRTGQVAQLLTGAEDQEEPPEEVLTAIRDTLYTAVARSMRADVPVGALLSGGLDSSLVCAIGAKVASEQGWTLPTFAVGLEGSDDLEAARRVAEAVGTEHHERVYTEDELIDWVPEVIGVIESFDPQLVHSSVPNLLVSRYAARYVKVVLIGEGADELFAGYEHYGDISSHEELHDELVETMRGLHNLGLQRVDRVASSNAVESRIPFLDFDVVELGLGLPAHWKLTNGDRPEKWLLRKAFEGWLPHDLLWRPKQQFGQGSGAREVLRDHYEATISEKEFQRDRTAVEPPLRTREELAYYRSFQQHLTGLEPEGVVGRFAEA